MLRAKIADQFGTLLLDIAAALLRYAERRYAGGYVFPAHQGVAWDDLPRVQALYEELVRRHGGDFEPDLFDDDSALHPSPSATVRVD